MPSQQLTIRDSAEVGAPPNQVLDMVRSAIDGGKVSPEQLPSLLNSLFDFQLRVDSRNAEIEFNRAFAEMKAVLPRVKKDGVKDMGSKGSIPYATYPALDAMLRPYEQRFGFSRSFPSRMVDGKLVMVCVVRHSAGHSIESMEPVMPDPGPGRNDSQARGSGRSYSKRYLTLDVYDIVTEGEDDDGKRAHAITQEQADNMNALIAEIGMTPAGREAFFKLADIKSVEEVQQHRYKDLMQALTAKRRQVSK